MFRKVIKWALIALGALFIIGAVSNLTGANDPDTTAAVEGIESDPTVEPTVEPTPEPTAEPTPDSTPQPTPVAISSQSDCATWAQAAKSERIDYSGQLLQSYGNPYASASQLTTVITQACHDATESANVYSLALGIVEDTARFAEATPEPTPKPTPKPTPEPTRVSYKGLDARGWDLLVKNPDQYIGNAYVVWACITQFDAATGDDTFLAYALNGSTEYWYSDGDNTMFTGDADQLRDFVEDDVVSIKVTSLGSFSYDTQIGGNTTVPWFQVEEIALQGSCA